MSRAPDSLAPSTAALLPVYNGPSEDPESHDRLPPGTRARFRSVRHRQGSAWPVCSVSACMPTPSGPDCLGVRPRPGQLRAAVAAAIAAYAKSGRMVDAALA